MAQPTKLSICAAVLLLSVLACGQPQSPTITPTLTSTATESPTLEPTQPPAFIDTPIPQPAPVETLPPTQPPTQPAEPAGVFWRVTALPAALPSAYAEVQVDAPADGAVWVSTSQGASRWFNQTWESVLSESEDMLASVDDEGRLWVLRSDASEIEAWLDGQWTAYGAESGWTDAPTSAEMSWWSPTSWRALNDLTGMLWLPTSRDVRLFDGERWSLFTLEDMSFPPPEMEDIGVIHRLVMGGGADLWVGECYYGGPGPMGGQGVRWFDRSTWLGAEVPLGPTCVSAITAEKAGNVWLGADDTVWRYRYSDQTWTEYHLPQEFLGDYNFAYARQLMVDGNGDAWVILELCGGASCSGPAQVYRIHKGEWSLIQDAPSWDLPLKHLAVDGSGQGWLFWDGEVYKLEGESMKTVASIMARSVDVSLDGRVWVVADEENGAALWLLEP